MPNVQEDALTILRALDELGATTIEDNQITGDVFALTHLDEDAFWRADRYLRRLEYVGGPSDETMGEIRWIEPGGFRFLQDTMRTRLPLTRDAEMVISQAVKNNLTSRQRLTNVLGFDRDRLDSACRQLEDFGLIRTFIEQDPFARFDVTQEGRQAVHRSFRDLQVPNVQAQIGAVFNAPVTGSNVQAVASAMNSQIEQTITQNDSTALRREIIEAIDNLVNEVRDALTLQQQTDYLQAADELKQEIAKPKPDPSKIERLRNFLSFGDSLGGTLELGQTSLELASSAWPYLTVLTKGIVQLLSVIS